MDDHKEYVFLLQYQESIHILTWHVAQIILFPGWHRRLIIFMILFTGPVNPAIYTGRINGLVGTSD